MTNDPSLSGLRYDRAVIVGLLLLIVGLAWAATVHQSQQMDAMDAAMWRDMQMSMNGMAASWTPVDALFFFIMWTTMMAAMMLPGATPMIAAFAAINRRRRERAAPHVPTATFVLGYLGAWTGFALAATVLQALLQSAGLLTTMLQSSSNYWSAALFIAAGLYQLSPLKERCLDYCRSPEGFILSEWRDGAAGATIMGLRHGLFCMGCCGVLMLLLFAVAVMDLRWVALLTILVTAEKLLPGAKFWRIAIGLALIAAGAGLALSAITVT